MNSQLHQIRVQIMFLAISFISHLLCPLHSEARDFPYTKGGTLYLKRGGNPGLSDPVETRRAEFLIAEDCELIAKIMQKAEPNVEWYCSTSEEPIIYNCEFDGVKYKDVETKKQMVEKGSFKVSIERGKAFADFTWDVNVEKETIEFKNTYPYKDDALAKAKDKMKIDIKSGNLKIFDILENQNGSGKCKKIDK